MAVTAKDVNRLRQMTGAGMMDCKKALVEADGDFDAAIEILRKKGQKISAKRADRDAKEGAIFIEANAERTHAALIELNCETDFVARNDDFQSMGGQIATLALNHEPADLAALEALPMDGVTVADVLTSAMGRIGEKIAVSKYEQLTGDQVVTYIHPGARIGVAVAFANTQGKDATDVGKDVAMQIAAMNPVAVDKDGVPQAIADKELEIGREQALAEGKPENIVDKIAMGKLQKFYKENTLLHQDFVKDTSRSVAKYIADELGKDVTVSGFVRLQLGME